jgi:hypothetical protein
MVVSNISESVVSLADLRSRRVPVEWFEAVAVVQELGRVLLESGGDPEHVSLAPQSVVINKAGRVGVIANPAPSGEPVVRRVGELLQMILADSPLPAPLRLVMMQSVSTPPSYASLAELGSALEYFERPDRTGQIRALYERAQTHAATPDVVEPSVQPTRQENATKPSTRPGRRLAKRTIGVSVAALTVIAIGVAVSQVSTQPQDGVPAAEQTTAGVSDQAAPDASSLQKAPENGVVAVRVLARPKDETDIVAPRDSAEEFSSTSGPATIEEEVTGIEPDAAASEAPFVEAVDTTIYSASDSDVTPPLATYPRLPARPPAGVRADEHSIMELLVGETGLVESARVLRPPHNLGEALLVTANLSAAKTWRFRPAVRGGQPVRYRTLVQVWPTTR